MAERFAHAEDAAPVGGTRTRTREGFLRAGITLTRPGVVEYDAAQLGVGQKGTKVRLRRTEESVFHPRTMLSARGAPITLRHPAAGDLTPASYREHAVGAIAGEPDRSEDDHLAADAVISDEAAIHAIEKGEDQASIRYQFNFAPTEGDDAEADYETVGPLDINHIALVKSGRAGPTVRVQDAQDQEVPMTKEEMKELLAEFRAANASDGSDQSPAMRKLAELTERVTKMAEAQDAAEKATTAAQAKADAEEAAKKLADSVRAEERGRYAVLQDALPMVAADKHDELKSATTREILEAALGDSIPDVKGQSDDYLRGALAVRKAAALASEEGAGVIAGIGPQKVGLAVGSDSRNTAHDDYVKRLTESYKLGNEKGA